MTKPALHIHLDAVGGVAGDMFIAAVLDAFPHLSEEMLRAIRLAGLPESLTCRVVEHRDDVLTGVRFLVEEPAYREREAGSRHLGGTAHRHVPFSDIRAALQASPLTPGVKERAIDMFTRLAHVEAKVHGARVDDVTFHELGGWDSIADIVGAAFLIDTLGADSWDVGPLPQGRGRVHTDHGWLPIPTPATTLLLEGFDLIDDGLQGERITPTGAVILRNIGADRPAVQRPRRLKCTGSGFGSKVFPGISNVLRVLAFEESAVNQSRDRIAHIAFEIDDQTAEDLAIGLDRLRAHPAVLDVLQSPAFGKKGRMTAHIQILAEPEELESIFDACFNETTTLGLRWQFVERRVLARTHETVDIDGRSVRVKIARRPEATTAKAESDDLRSLTGGRKQRERVRSEAERARLKGDVS